MATFFADKQLKSKSGLVPGAEALGDKEVVAVYFSAHWCPPCRAFTPVLKDFYEEVLGEGGKLALIFVSSDRSEGDMESYFKDHHGDWFAVPFGDEIAAKLKKNCSVTGIPKLVIVNSRGEVVHGDARSDVHKSKPMATYKKWLELKK